jgi:hypothetical protein
MLALEFIFAQLEFIKLLQASLPQGTYIGL